MTKNNLLQEATPSNKFCTSPWNEVHLHATGKVRMCCQHQGLDKNIRDVTLMEAFNDEAYKLARKQTVSNIWPKGCNQCVRSEAHSGFGLRYMNTQQTIDERTWHADFGTGTIQKVGIDFSNACNLRCTFCDPSKSTGWYKDAKMLDNALGEESWRAFHRPSKEPYGIPTDFVDKNLDTLLKTKQIECGGGEPFYMPQFMYLLDKLIEHNYQGRLKIITNATLLKPETLEKIKNINVSFVVSMDGTGHIYPYMRPSTPFGKYSWEEIEEKILHIVKEFKTINISYTPNTLNIYNIPTYIEWVEENIVPLGIPFFKNRFFNQAITSPEYLRIAVHPDEDYKHELADMLEKKDAKGFNDIITQCRNPRTDKEISDWKFFCKTTDLLDKHRKTSIIKYIPELEKYWIKT